MRHKWREKVLSLYVGVTQCERLFKLLLLFNRKSESLGTQVVNKKVSS